MTSESANVIKGIGITGTAIVAMVVFAYGVERMLSKPSHSVRELRKQQAKNQFIKGE